MIKIDFNRIYGKAITHYLKNEYINLMIYDSAVDRDADRMNIWLSEYAILNPLT